LSGLSLFYGQLNILTPVRLDTGKRDFDPGSDGSTVPHVIEKPAAGA
jgi:hypothetical protein